MKKILSVFMAICTVLTALCIPPAPAVAQSTEKASTPVSEQIDQTVTLPIEEEPITLETLTEDCKILQYVDEEAFAAADHAFRLPDLEELDTYVFQNTDGTRSVYYLYENVKFYDEQGNIREKDNTLQRETKGFRITENEFDLLLPHAVTDGVELTYQGYDVKLIPATAGMLTATAPGSLRENSVVYESFFGAGTSLVYTPLLSGVKEEIVLEEYLPNKSFSFLLYTDGLFLNNTDGSYILAESKASAEAVLYLGDIVVYDAIGRPSLGNLTAETVKDGNVYALTMSADEGFLSDPATVYPVTIDPDLTISDTNNGSGAIEDTTLFSGTPNLNTGDWVYNTAGYVDETYGAGRILVRLPGLYNSSVFQGLEPNDINSCIFYCTRTSIKSTESVKLYLSNGAWTESTATWSNFGNGSNYYSDTAWSTVAFNGTALSFNISALVRAWRRGAYSASNGFVLVNDNETSASYKCGVYSSEHSNTEKRPYFVMNYDADIVLNKASTTIAVGNTEPLVATTTPAGGLVSWTSSNNYVATVSSSGVVDAEAPGFATITATYIDADGESHTAQCTVLVKMLDDIYTINNSSQSKLLQLPANAYDADAEGYDVYGKIGVYDEEDRWTYFKINHLGNGVYSIRSMLNNSMGLKRSGNSVVCGSIGTSNDTVPDEAKWAFGTDSGGTYIYSYNGGHVATPQYTLICAPAIALVDDVVLQSYYAGYELQTWAITPVTANCEGVTIWKKTDERLVGEEFDFEAAVYTTNLHLHGGGAVTWSVTNGTGSATIDSSAGILTATSIGSVTVTATYTRNTTQQWSTSHTVYILPFENGVYFLSNRQTAMYADIENQTMAYGALIHQWEFHGGRSQQWEISHYGEGYFTIRSTHSNTAYYLGVETEALETDADIILRNGTVRDEMLWKFIPTSGGAYRIVSKLAENSTTARALVATTSEEENGYRLAYGNYVPNDSYRDEWKLVYTSIQLNVPLIAQQTGSWCWVTSAQMMARTLFPNAVNTGDESLRLEEQRKAVFHVFGEGSYEAYNWDSDPQNLKIQGGIFYDVAEAAAYLSGLEDGEITFSGYASPYSLESLLRFLSDGYPVARLCGSATIPCDVELTLENLPSIIETMAEEASGHVTVITGVEWSAEENSYVFKVNNPASGGHQENLTYQELMFSIETRDESSVRATIWFPTAVVKTNYSQKGFVGELIGADYSS